MLLILLPGDLACTSHMRVCQRVVHGLPHSQEGWSCSESHKRKTGSRRFDFLYMSRGNVLFNYCIFKIVGKSLPLFLKIMFSIKQITANCYVHNKKIKNLFKIKSEKKSNLYLLFPDQLHTVTSYTAHKDFTSLPCTIPRPR